MSLSISTLKGRWIVWGQSEKTGSSPTGDGEEISGGSEETVRTLTLKPLMDQVYSKDHHTSRLPKQQVIN